MSANNAIIDAVIVAASRGYIVCDEQKLLIALAINDTSTGQEFLEYIQLRGIERGSKLLHMLTHALMYPSLYPIAGLMAQAKSGATPSFLGNHNAPDIVLPFLTTSQLAKFEKILSAFYLEHLPMFHDKRKGWRAGKFAGEPKDNAHVLPRFETFLRHQLGKCNNPATTSAAGFPTDIVMGLFRRVFLTDDEARV